MIGKGSETVRLRIAERLEDVEALRETWQAVRWPRAEFDLDFFLVALRTSGDIKPYAAFVERDGAPAAAIVGTLEEARLATKVGYRTLYRPSVRALTVLPGGAYGTDDEAAGRVLAAVGGTLSRGEADVVSLLGLATGSSLHRGAMKLGGPLRRQLFTPRRLHWRLELPATLDEFLASRSRSTREGVKRYRKRLEKTFGDDVSVELLRGSSDLDRIAHDLDVVAGKTYQAGLGVAFSNVEDQRRRIALGLERGWFRAWVLSIAGVPVAFWHGYVYNRTFVIGIPGYDPAYADHRVGTYLQLRMIADLCADPEVDAIDYGRGDAEYKRRFGTESWEEQDTVVFAPSVRGVAINLVRNAILGSAQGARRALTAVGLADHLKKRWRDELRQPPSSANG